MPLLRRFPTRPLLMGLLLALAETTAGVAQDGPDSGAFLVRLGTDTLAVERYQRVAGELRGDIVLRVPEARRVRYVATLSGGRVSGLELESEPLTHGVHGGTSSRGVMRFRGDTAEVSLELHDGVRRLRVPARPGAVPLSAFSHALVEQALLQASREGRDSVEFDWIGLGAPHAMPSYVVRCGRDSVRVAFFGYPSYAVVDRRGRMLRLDGRETTLKVQVERRPAVDLERWAARFAASEARSGPMGPLSPRDTLRTVLRGAELVIDYGRPRKRGRDIFGHLVAWDRVWRLGANAATQLTTSADLSAAGHVIPAGTYSLWLVPHRQGGTLVVNRQTGQWGTAYDQAQDLARLPLTLHALALPLEQLTMSVEPVPGGGLLRVAWDTRAYTLPFFIVDPAGPPRADR